jgi:GNAT superfamily N-acetyltransferase
MRDQIGTTMEEWKKGDLSISTDPQRLNLELIHDYLSNESYWAQGRALETVRRSIANSLSFGVYKKDQQIAFARVVTDYATFAWIADVFVLGEHRGQGIATWLMDTIVSHPQLQGFRRWVLSTRDAHELYKKFGFRELKRPERWMERPDPAMQESTDYWMDAQSSHNVNDRRSS